MLSIVNRFRQKKKKKLRNLKHRRRKIFTDTWCIIRRSFEGTGLELNGGGDLVTKISFISTTNDARAARERWTNFTKSSAPRTQLAHKLYPLNPRELFLRSDTQRFRWNIYPVNATALRAMDKFITANIPSMRSRSPCYKASSDRGKKNKKNKKYVVNYCLDARIISLPAFRAYEARAARKSGGGMPRVLRSWSYVKNRFD